MKTNIYYLLTFNHDTSSPEIVETFTNVSMAIKTATSNKLIRPELDFWIENQSGKIIYA